MRTAEFLDDLRRCGPDKPLSYLPISSLAFINGQSAEDAVSEATSCGLQARIFEHGTCVVASGAVYVWHEDALSALLERCKDKLEPNGWPVDPHAFVEMVATRFAADGSAPSAVIGVAFGNPKYDPETLVNIYRASRRNR